MKERHLLVPGLFLLLISNTSCAAGDGYAESVKTSVDALNVDISGENVGQSTYNDADILHKIWIDSSREEREQLLLQRERSGEQRFATSLIRLFFEEQYGTRQGIFEAISGVLRQAGEQNVQDLPREVRVLLHQLPEVASFVETTPEDKLHIRPGDTVTLGAMLMQFNVMPLRALAMESDFELMPEERIVAQERDLFAWLKKIEATARKEGPMPEMPAQKPPLEYTNREIAALWKLGENDLLQEIAKEKSALEPENLSAQLLQALLLVREKKYDQAVALGKEAHSKLPAYGATGYNQELSLPFSLIKGLYVQNEKALFEQKPFYVERQLEEWLNLTDLWTASHAAASAPEAAKVK